MGAGFGFLGPVGEGRVSDSRVEGLGKEPESMRWRGWVVGEGVFTFSLGGRSRARFLCGSFPDVSLLGGGRFELGVVSLNGLGDCRTCSRCRDRVAFFGVSMFMYRHRTLLDSGCGAVASYSCAMLKEFSLNGDIGPPVFAFRFSRSSISLYVGGVSES